MVSNESNLTTFCGTMQYLAPEVLIRNNNNPNDLSPYDSSVDLWSCGVIFFNILSATSPFNNDSLNNQILSAMYHYADPIWSNISNDAKDLIDHLIVKDPTQRYTASQALDHKWFKDKILKDCKKEYNDFIDQYQAFGPNCPTPDLDSYLLKQSDGNNTDGVSNSDTNNSNSNNNINNNNRGTRSNPLPITTNNPVSVTGGGVGGGSSNVKENDLSCNPLDKKSQSEELSQIVNNMTFNSPTLLSQNGNSQFVQLPPDSQPSQQQQQQQSVQPIQQSVQPTQPHLPSILESDSSLNSLSLSLDNNDNKNNSINNNLNEEEEVRSSISTSTIGTTPLTTPIPTPTTSNQAIISNENEDENDNEDDKMKRGRNENITKVKLVKDINVGGVGGIRKRQKINATSYSTKTTVEDDEIEAFESD